MPRKFTLGQAWAAPSRNMPLPKPTSSSTGRSLPKTSGQLSRTGGSGTSSKYGANCSSDKRPAGRTTETPRSIFEEHDDRGEPVDEVLAADRAELTGGEEAGQRDVSGLGADGAGVVVRFGEQPGAAAVASKR